MLLRIFLLSTTFVFLSPLLPIIVAANCETQSRPFWGSPILPRETRKSSQSFLRRYKDDDDDGKTRPFAFVATSSRSNTGGITIPYSEHDHSTGIRIPRKQPYQTTTTTTTTTTLCMSTTNDDNQKPSNNIYYDDDYDDEYDYDLLVIGGGPGGIAMARRAEQYGLAHIALVDTQGPHQLGGTCVHVGSYPQKVMWYTASIAETLQNMKHYGFTAPEGIQFDWTRLKRHRDAYLERLTTIYNRNMVEDSAIDVIQGLAQFTTDPHTVQIRVSPDDDDDDDVEAYTEEYTARHIVIATGAKPLVQDNIREHTITTDEFFQLDDMPSKIVVVGGGCTAVEMAGIVQSLGCDTSLVLRDRRPLWNICATPLQQQQQQRSDDDDDDDDDDNTTTTATRKFDEMLIDGIYEEMQKHGIFIYRNTNGIESISTTSTNGMEDSDTKTNNKKTVTLKNGEVIDQVDVVLMAIGRTPRTETLQLSNAGILQEDFSTKGYIQVNEQSETNVQGIYAIGDVSTTFPHVTPMAIASGRRLADRLFGSPSSSTTTTTATIRNNRMDGFALAPPQVIFSQPPMGMVGLTETQAIEQYGQENVVVYRSKFSNIYYGVWQNVDPDEKPQTSMKMICCTNTNANGSDHEEERVVGLHVIGLGADEMIQGFGVAVQMGATKADFDACLAIHPTASEEFVTMYPWGMTKATSIANDNNSHANEEEKEEASS